MDGLLKKLNYRPPATVSVLGAPPEAKPVLAAWEAEAKVKRRLGKNERFVLAFVRSAADVGKRAPALAAALDDDGIVWMAYPKRSSKRYRSDLAQMDGWQPLGDLGFEPVRQVSFDEDWSAVRFRPAEHIAEMKRDPAMAMSREGKRRAGAGKARDDPAIAEYIAGLPDDRRRAVQRVHEVVRKAAPELKPLMAMGVINYGPFHYRYASGREGDWYVVTLANRKQYVSLYLCATVDGQYVAEANAARLGKVSVGKSCVRFKHLDDIDLGVVAELVRTSADAMAGSLLDG